MGKTLTEIKSEEERERAKAADKKRNQKEKMNKLAAKMSKAQQDIDERRAQNAKKIQNEEKCDKERFIAAGEAEQHTSDDRASKRGEIEKTANELKEYNFSEMVRKRQYYVCGARCWGQPQPIGWGEVTAV